MYACWRVCVVVARRVTAVRLARITLVRGKQRRVVKYVLAMARQAERKDDVRRQLAWNVVAVRRSKNTSCWFPINEYCYLVKYSTRHYSSIFALVIYEVKIACVSNGVLMHNKWQVMYWRNDWRDAHSALQVDMYKMCSKACPCMVIGWHHSLIE